MEAIIVISVTSFIGLVGIIHLTQSVVKFVKEKRTNAKEKKNLNVICKKHKLNPNTL